MAPHRNIPSTTPSIKPVKPERTMRSHEENQERAYIAASRRSDRSLEARVESARRASDIHKKRTGRALRVTEQDVMNEEMYEEEDDDIPWRYRSVTSHLPLDDGLLSRRLQSMLAVQLENQRLLGQAVNSTLQHNPQYANAGQFMSPNMMHMPQNPFQNAMPPPQHLNRTQSSYRHTPYPMQQSQQQPRPNYHQRSISVATAQDASGAFQQYSQNPQSMPLHQSPHHDRRTSLPQQPHGLPRSSGVSSHQGSAPSTPSYHQASTSPDNRLHAQPAGTSSHSTSRQPTPQQEMSNPFAPFSMTLPLDTQQLLAGSDNYPSLDMFGTAPEYPMKPQQPFYSYRPNGSGSSLKNPPNNAGGLDQTLLSGSLDTSVSNASNLVDTPTSATSGPLYSAHTDPGFGFGGYEPSMFKLDAFSNSGFSSGHVTPGACGYNEPLFSDFLEQDMFGDLQASQG